MKKTLSVLRMKIAQTHSSERTATSVIRLVKRASKTHSCLMKMLATLSLRMKRILSVTVSFCDDDDNDNDCHSDGYGNDAVDDYKDGDVGGGDNKGVENYHNDSGTADGGDGGADDDVGDNHRGDVDSYDGSDVDCADDDMSNGDEGGAYIVIVLIIMMVVMVVMKVTIMIEMTKMMILLVIRLLLLVLMKIVVLIVEVMTVAMVIAKALTLMMLQLLLVMVMKMMMLYYHHLTILNHGAHYFWNSWKFEIFFKGPGKLLEEQIISLDSWKTPGRTDNFPGLLENSWKNR